MIVPWKELVLKKNTRLLGIDHGHVRMGLALSDPLLKVATPLQVLTHPYRRDLEKIIDMWGIGAIVIGFPLHLGGQQGTRCQDVQKFAEALMSLSLPLALWDERLSTSAVENVLVKEADLSRKKRKKVVDKLAATFFLQGCLDALRYEAHKTKSSS